MRVPYNTAAFVCSHIFGATRPILYVCRAGGDWQFLCGEPHAEAELPEVVGVGHLVDRDSSLEEVLDLPPDWEAERDAQLSVWRRKRIQRP